MSGWRDPIPNNPDGRLVGVELRHLAALQAIAQEGSFRGAAESLGYVQSAVSHQLAALERLTGTRLVERSRNAPVSLTSAGRLMLEHTDSILSHFRAAESKLVALSEGRAGTLRVGAFQSVAGNVLPRLMAAFARARTDIRIEVTETPTDAPLLDLLENNEIDLAFCEAGWPGYPFEGVPLMEDPFVLVVSEHAPLARAVAPPALADLCDVRLIGFNAASRVHGGLLETLDNHGVEPRFAFRADMNSTVQSLVAAGLGVAIVPYLTVDPTVHATAILALPELPVRDISLIWHRERPRAPASELFTQIASSKCPKFRKSRPPALDANPG